MSYHIFLYRCQSKTLGTLARELVGQYPGFSKEKSRQREKQLGKSRAGAADQEDQN